MNASYFFLIDEQAPNSLRLVQALERVADVERESDGIYIVTGAESHVFDVAEDFPNVVMKVEKV